MGDIPDNSPDSGVIRHGHIPSAINICWENSVLVNARFRSVSDLKAAFAPALKAEKVFVYCYQGHQAAHAWFYRFDHRGIVVSAVGARCGKAFKADGKWNICANTHALSVDESIADRDYCWYILNNETW